MVRVESDSILRNALRDLRRIEFPEMVRRSSLGADSRAFSQILRYFGLLRSDCQEFYDGFYVELAWKSSSEFREQGPSAVNED